jgi:hypothetical protein
MKSHSWDKPSALLLDFLTDLRGNFDCAYGGHVRYWPDDVQLYTWRAVSIIGTMLPRHGMV